MKKTILSVSLLALSAPAAWAQGTTTAPYGQPTVPPPAPTYQPTGPATAPAPAPTYGRPMAPTPAPTTAQPTATQASSPQRDVPPYTAEVGPRQGDWEAFIGGSGTSREEFDNNTLGVTGSIGYYVLKFLPVRLQQSYVTTFGDSVNNENQFATTGAIDLQAPLGRFQP